MGIKGLAWAREKFPNTPVVYVPGNHEYCGGQLQDVSDALRYIAERLEIALLDGDEMVIGGVRFLAATLWTDFALHGSELRLQSLYTQRNLADNRFSFVGAQAASEL